MKQLLIAAGVLVPLALYYGWKYMTGPFYVYGMLRDGAVGVVEPAKNKDTQMVNVGGDIELYQDVVGNGGKGVFVVHGGPGRPYDGPWEGMVKQGEYTYHFYHQRGCGKSTRPVLTVPEGLSFPEAMKYVVARVGFDQDILDIERLRIALGYDKITLLGHSWGGFISALYAAEYPERVEKLVLVSPAAALVFPPPKEMDFFANIKSRLPEEDRPAFDDFVKNVILDFSPAMWKKTDDQIIAAEEPMGFYYFKALKVDISTRPAPTHKAGGWSTKGTYMSLGMHHDYTHALKNITMPTLLIECADDMINDPLYRSIKGVQVVSISKATHFPFYENPEEFTAALADFM
eukprot:TRINITY_DN1634_c0_g1_i1.p1 TRINITY_DN1634_c0_g1~~TRINITY_DN1634_c0_g1_i1.p1  ORF type:complete len:346 (+),score=96.76 TRINITY_DN1634_c0_g1_i1:38-1075(+)